jgi:hypothetical protein
MRANESAARGCERNPRGTGNTLTPVRFVCVYVGQLRQPKASWTPLPPPAGIRMWLVTGAAIPLGGWLAA